MAIVIRHAREDELDETSRVLAAAFAGATLPDAALTPEHRESFARYLEEAANVRSRWLDAELFVAVESDRILGTATLYPPNRAPVYPVGPKGKTWPREWAALRLLGVDPPQRGRGVGRMLSEARVRRARELGAPIVALHTAHLFAVARSMYRRMGWKRAPEYDHYPLPEVCAEAYFLELART